MTNAMEYRGGIEILVPKAPEGLPESVQQEWLLVHDATLKTARDKYPADEGLQRRLALCEANKLLQTPDISDYDAAMALAPWHFVLRAPSTDGKVLRIVTRHGRKMILPIPGQQTL